MKMNPLLVFGVFFAFAVNAFAAKPAEVTLENVRDTYLKREGVINKALKSEKANLPKDAKAEDLLPVMSPLRNATLFHLRYLTHLERTLRMMVIDQDTRREQLKSELLPSGEDRRIVKMWNELQAERFLQLAPPPVDKRGRRRRGDGDSAEAELNDRYASRTKILLKKLEGSEKRLDAALSKDRLDERLIAKLEKEIAAFEAQVEEMRLAYFGDSSTDGFESPFESAGDTPAEKLLVDVVQSRDALLRVLRGEEPLKQEGAKKKANIGEMFIESQNLGVILDVSSSMTAFIKPLKEEIAQEFSSPHYREVPGCRMDWSLIPIGAKPDGSMLAMEDLLIVLKADTIFWFSDLNDGESPQALARLQWLLDISKANFYVNSVGKKPSRGLEPLVTEFRKK
jgi:hypothetical protein